jgi:hypothetical protein
MDFFLFRKLRVEVSRTTLLWIGKSKKNCWIRKCSALLFHAASYSSILLPKIRPSKIKNIIHKWYQMKIWIIFWNLKLWQENVPFGEKTPETWSMYDFVCLFRKLRAGTSRNLYNGVWQENHKHKKKSFPRRDNHRKSTGVNISTTSHKVVKYRTARRTVCYFRKSSWTKSLTKVYKKKLHEVPSSN